MNPSFIKDKIQNELTPTQLKVTDLTGAGDHFEVVIQADCLKGLSRIQQHMKIMKLFDDELQSGELHLLTIKVIQ
ncbi:MAG: BolA family transcriptional regulator [Bdellovibrionales bacterium CG10_big_fil_rev_8_21_14_0_10_45_34]|nr:MAG: BolA family transcriptional regulator [Bdellovibrionales bacterium CG10_big_fil_rev_8_21_14_0_10_45_34]